LLGYDAAPPLILRADSRRFIRKRQAFPLSRDPTSIETGGEGGNPSIRLDGRYWAKAATKRRTSPLSGSSKITRVLRFGLHFKHLMLLSARVMTAFFEVPAKAESVIRWKSF